MSKSIIVTAAQLFASVSGNTEYEAGIRSLSTKGANRFLADSGLVGGEVISVGETKITVAFFEEGNKAKRRVDVPVRFFSKAFLNAVYKRLFKDGEKVTMGDFVRFVVLSCIDVQAFKNELEHLNRNSTLILNIGTAEAMWTGLASPELFGTRLFSTFIKDSVFGIQRGETVFTPNAATKLIARVHSIGYNKPLFVTGEKRIGIIMDTANEELAAILATGAIFVGNEIVREIGIARITSKRLGLKACTTLADDSFMNQFVGVDAVASAGCVKAGVRGVYCALTGCTFEEAIMASEEVVAETVKAAVKNVNTKFGVLPMVFVKESLGVTNPYSIYGYSWADKNEPVSFYDTVVSGFNTGDITSVPEFLEMCIENGTVVKDRDITQVKFAEVQNALLSFGRETAIQFLDSLKPSNKLKAHFAKVEANFDEDETVEVFKTITADYAGMIQVGSFTPDNFRSGAAYDAALEFFMNGGTLSSGKVFPGFASKEDIAFSIGGEVFYFPGVANVEGEFMPKEGETYEYGVNLGQVAGEVIQLILSWRNPKTDWFVKSIRFNAGMSNAILREEFNSFDVRGKYFAQMTVTWGDKDPANVFAVRKGYHGRMTFGKMPVLFNKAICDVNVKSAPFKAFKNMDATIELACQCAAWINPELQLGQGNDSDGDQVRLTKTGGILPLYTEQSVAKQYWAAYRADEMDVNLFKKSLKVKEWHISECHPSMSVAKENKSNVGMYTSELFVVQHGLDCMERAGEISLSNAAIIKEVYALTMQDEAVRAIKHETGGSQFSLISISNVLRGEVDMAEAAETLVSVAQEKLGEVLDLNVANAFVEGIVIALRASNVSAWSSRNITSRNIDSFFCMARHSFALHSFFVRTTWVKGQAKANGEGLKAYGRDSLWQMADASQYGRKYIKMWFTRIGTGDAFVKAFGINKDGSLAERAYMNALEAFGSNPIEPSKIVEVKEEEVSVDTSDIDYIDSLIGESTPATSVVKEEKEEVAKVVTITEKKGEVVLSYNGVEKHIAYSTEGTVAENNSAAVEALASAMVLVKEGFAIDVYVQHAYISNTVRHFKKWVEKEAVSKDAKNKEAWTTILNVVLTRDVVFC